MFVAAVLILVTPSKAGTVTEDFRTMSPTVRIISYRRTVADRIDPLGAGSGTVITRGGRVLTNYHVIFNEQERQPCNTFEINITFDLRQKPVRKYTAALVAYDKDLDLALLQIDKTDVWGRPISTFAYHDWNARVAPKEGQSIQVFGYPASGGETLTVTRGQISGFDKLNEYVCFKTDTDIDHGSSGGTVLGRRNRFIGIPVYLRTYAANVGYVLDIREARPWIAAHLDDPVIVDKVAQKRLVAEMAAFTRANRDHAYQTDIYPRIALKLPDTWQLKGLSVDSIIAAQDDVADSAAIAIRMDRRPFALDAAFKARLLDDLLATLKRLPGFKREETTLAGCEAWKVTYPTDGTRHTVWHVFRGNTLVHILYGVDDRVAEKQQQAIDAFLAGFRFIDGPDSPVPPPQRTFFFREPGLNITLPPGWGGRIPAGSDSVDLILLAWQKDNYDGILRLSYRRISNAHRAMSARERIKEVMNSGYGRRVLRRQDDVRVGGMPGWFLVTEEAGARPGDPWRRLLGVLTHGDHEIVVEYTDKANQFDANNDDLRRIFASITVRENPSQSEDKTNIGVFGMRFTDIRYHRYALPIMQLASRDLLKAYPGEHFGPEEPATRAKALRLVIDTWNETARNKQSARQIDVGTPPATAPFTDVPADQPLAPYAAAAARRGLLPGAAPKRFDPEGPVSLVEILRLIFAVYHVPLWSGTTSPPWKGILDKGYELSLVPRGIDAPDHRLTNAELVAIVAAIFQANE